jgi:hypothetical protein
VSAVRIAAQLEEARDTARRLFGLDYEERVGKWRAKVRECCEVWSCRPIEIPPTLERAGCLPKNPLLLFAAIVEEIENPTTTNQQGESMPSTKTKRAPKSKSESNETADPSDVAAQNAEKMKKIRSQRRVVKKCEIDVGNATEARKLAKEELEAARAELYRLIDDSPQAELFVGHVSTETGELETDD